MCLGCGGEYQLSRLTALRAMGRDMSKHDKAAKMCHNTALKLCLAGLLSS